MANRDPGHLYRPGFWNNYGAKAGGHGGGSIAPPGQRDPMHLYRPGFWDNYGAKSAGGSGAGGSGGKGGKAGRKKAKAKRVAYSRHALPAAAMRDPWGHRFQAGGQG